MTPKEIKDLFPVEIVITDNHKEQADKRGGQHYIGNILLEEILPKEHHQDIFWGLSIGNIQSVKLQTFAKIKYKNSTITIPLYLDKNLTENIIKFELR